MVDYMAMDEEIDRIPPKAVIGRIDEWQRDLRDLFAEIKGWCDDNGFKTELIENSVEMNEYPMKQYHIGPELLPELRVVNPGSGARVDVVPIGLWVIGADGRVDLRTRDGDFSILNRTLRDDRKPRWEVFGPGMRDGLPFKPEILRRFLVEGQS